MLASNNLPAHRLTEMCRQLQLRVPEDVALLGVNNDELECLLANPPLSSVLNPSEQIGYEAAQLLDQLMSQPQQRSRATIFVPPGHVIARQSTNVIACPDADITAATAYIRNHLAEDVSVGTLAKKRGLIAAQAGAPLPRISRPHRAARDSPRRIERAKQLLAENRHSHPARGPAVGFFESPAIDGGFSPRDRRPARVVSAPLPHAAVDGRGAGT